MPDVIYWMINVSVEDVLLQNKDLMAHTEYCD